MAFRFFLITLGFLCGFFVFGLPSLTSSDHGEVTREKDKFEIVDKYKNCDVVRYSPAFAATYKYLLHCSTPQ